MKELVGAIVARRLPRDTEIESDEHTLEALYDLHAAALFRYARALTGSPADAEDALVGHA